MQLTRYIQAETRQAQAAGKTSAAEHYRACLRSISAYLGEGQDIDLLQTIATGWIEGYTAFLTTGYAASQGRDTISAATAGKHLKTLRILLRSAIQQGLLPCIDVLQTASDTVTSTIKASPLPTQAIDHIKSLCMQPKSEVLLRELSLTLLAFWCVGMEVGTLAQLGADSYHNGTISLPHLGLTLPLPAAAQALADKYGSQSATPFASSIHDTSLAQAVLHKAGIPPCHATNDIFLWWLCVAQQKGVSLQVLRDIVALRYSPTPHPAEGLSAAIADAIATVCCDDGAFTRQWYAMRCFGTTGDKLAERLQNDDTLPLDAADLYAPYDELPRKRDGHLGKTNNPAVSHLLFLHTTLSAVTKVQDTFRQEAMVYRSASSPQRFATIPDRQIATFKALLGVDDDNLEAIETEKFQIGRRVRVIGGLYSGFEGKLIRIKGNRRFVVGIEGVCAFVTSVIPARLIEPLD